MYKILVKKPAFGDADIHGNTTLKHMLTEMWLRCVMDLSSNRWGLVTAYKEHSNELLSII